MATADREVDAAWCGGYMRINAPQRGAPTDPFGQIWQKLGADLVENEVYRIRYDLREARNSSFSVDVISEQTGGGSFGYMEDPDPGAEWTHYEDTFTATTPGGYNNEGVRVRLWINRFATRIIDLDNIVLTLEP
jgi:hypothetical protein